MIRQDAHPTLYPKAFICRFPKKIGAYSDGELSDIRYFFQTNIQSPLHTPDSQAQIRDMLRHGGFSPSGRNKPAHEYLHKAIDKGWFTPTSGINAAVDCCNVVSLHGALPISVVDTAKIEGKLQIRLCPKECTYPFNPSGQVLKAGGLIALWDEHGPSATPVKDSQRSKTDDNSTETLSIIWGHQALKDHVEAAYQWYQVLLKTLGAELEAMPILQKED